MEDLSGTHFLTRLRNKRVIEAQKYKNKCLYLLLLHGDFFVEKMEAKEEMERKQPTLTSRGIIYARRNIFLYRILFNSLRFSLSIQT